MEPIVIQQRSNDAQSLWITHKTAIIQDRGQNIHLTGLVQIQSLRAQHFILSFRNFRIAVNHESSCEDITSNKADDDCKGGAIPKVQLFLFETGNPETWMVDIANIGYQVEVKLPGNNCSLNDLLDNIPEEKSFRVPVQREVINAVGFAIASVESEGTSVIVYAIGEFVKDGKETDPFQIVTRQSGIQQSLTERKLNDSYHSTALTRLDISKDISLDTLEQYRVITRGVWHDLKKAKNDQLSFDDFKLGLKLANITAFESRAASLFQACNLAKSGKITMTEFEVALMVNDAYPAPENCSSIYELFHTFDLDNSQSLDLDQFMECVHALCFELGMKKNRIDKLRSVFHKVAPSGRISYDTFVTVWCRKITNAGNELRRRGLANKEQGRVGWAWNIIQWMRRFWDGRTSRYYLLQEFNRTEYKIISRFPSVRDEIVQLRSQAQKSRDANRRSERKYILRQQRSNVLHDSSVRRKHQKMARIEKQVEREGKIEHLEKSERILRERQDNLKLRHQDYIQCRDQNNAIEKEEIVLTGGDKLILSDRGLEEIPTSLYMGDVAKSRLVNIKLLDLSGNTLYSLPGMYFTFHMLSLRKLCLSRNKLTNLPKELSALKNLEILMIDQNEFVELPTYIDELESLQILNFSLNKIRSLQEEICSFAAVKVLIAQSNLISSIFHGISRLRNLEVVDLSKNKLVTLPEHFCSLVKLIKADLSMNSITELPVNIGSLTKLEHFNISFNRVQDLPDSISKLTNIHIFALEGNCLLEIPDCVRGWKSIIDFECKNNQIAQISQDVGSLSSLRRISWSRNKIKSLPPEIGLLKDLLHINLQANAIQSLPVEIGALKNLQTIDVSHNLLSYLPHEFCLIKSLSWLDISHNKLEELPKAFGGLSNLVVCKMSHNCVKEFPMTFKELFNLKELEASSNNFSCFQRDLCYGLSSLVLINFDYNKIDFIPSEIVLMPFLRNVQLRSNKLKAIPPNLGESINKLGEHLELDIRQNPLGSLPFKFTSIWANRQRYQNPSGYSNTEVIHWMEEENVFYSVAVDEWEETKLAHLGRELGFDEFMEGLINRCEKYDVPNGKLSAQLKGGTYTNMIKQFYFSCKKTGNPPTFSCCNEDKKMQMDKEKDFLQCLRDERANSAKDIDLKHRAADENLYVGCLSARCKNVEARLSVSQASREKIKSFQREILMSEIQTKIVEKENIVAKNDAIARLESKIEVKQLQKLYFEGNENRERYVPLEIKACWKPAQRS